MARYDVVKAVGAMRQLVKDPDDLPKVFTLIDSLQGNAAERLRAGFEKTETGRGLLTEQPDIVPVLSNREALRAMPEGSLAHAYLAFVESENISADGLVAAAEAGRAQADDGFSWQRNRMRDTHDLWHAVTGYRGDVLGELSLLAFLLAQHFQPGIALGVAGALTRELTMAERWTIAEGFVRGKKAEWLPAQKWEALLPMPVDEVRRLLKVGSPPQYRPVRSAELKTRREQKN